MSDHVDESGSHSAYSLGAISAKNEWSHHIEHDACCYNRPTESRDSAEFKSASNSFVALCNVSLQDWEEQK